MLSQQLEEALNKQLNKELHSAYIYQSMAAYFESTDFEGMALWMDHQTQEEMIHARKFYDYINERGGRVRLTGIEAPKVDWDSPLSVYQDALEHERYITKSIYELVDLAQGERDHMTNAFLQWFITEQAEEEATASAVISKLERVKNSPDGTFMMDRELAKRPAPVATSSAAV
ncbi:MAG: ferritin [Cyanobacteriota bacterium]